MMSDEGKLVTDVIKCARALLADPESNSAQGNIRSALLRFDAAQIEQTREVAPNVMSLSNLATVEKRAKQLADAMHALNLIRRPNKVVLYVGGIPTPHSERMDERSIEITIPIDWATDILVTVARQERDALANLGVKT